MSYNYSNNNSGGSLLGLLIALFIFFIIVASNTSPDSVWNDGVCPDCDTHYLLQKSRKGWHHYICPECDTEVTRYDPFPF